jgi:tRNA A37 threonylcarbamoyladenosine biosynthesis protein TsaE
MVNKKRGTNYKEVLEEKDICLVEVPSKMRGATDKRSFAVMIAKVNARLNATTNIATYTYKCVTRVGYLNKNCIEHNYYIKKI